MFKGVSEYSVARSVPGAEEIYKESDPWIFMLEIVGKFSGFCSISVSLECSSSPISVFPRY